MKRKFTAKGVCNPFSKKKTLACFTFLFLMMLTAQAQFIHPGISHKKSDLDRMKYMVDAQISPYYNSYQDMILDAKASYNYVVQGNTSMTVLYRDSPKTNLSAFESDSRAAYYNALRWYITGDTRYASKAVEIFNAWTGLTYIQHSGTQALTSCLIYQMVEAAEIIKTTYTGWSTTDINKFKAMLVYPGYSNTTVPADLVTQGTWYWRAYKFDYIRAGNQELSAIRACLAMGVFLDNQIMYDRALRYVSGLTHRSDDLPYASGPHTKGSVTATTDYQIEYDFTVGSSVPDYGFNGVLTNYIYSNGQCQESSRDQVHTMWGQSLLCSVGEIAWNQGTDFWGASDSRILLGLEYNMKYSVSYVASYSDQLTEWTPTVASGEFIQGMDRTNRTKSLAMSPIYGDDATRILRGTFNTVAAWELPLSHYVGRGFKTETQAKWTTRARDKSIEMNGKFETAPSNGAYLGYGGLTFRRPTGCYGDPISGFSSGLPVYAMNVLPGTIEAENYDYTPVSAQGRTYNDVTTTNSGGMYRTADGVDIQTCSEGGYNIGWMASGEWLTYTINVPTTSTYDISIRYAASASGAKVKFMFDGVDKTGEVAVASTGGTQIWKTLVIKSGASLSQGVQSMKILVSGTSNKLNLNNIIISNTGTSKLTEGLVKESIESDETVEVYPNPVSNLLTITNSKGANVQVSDGLGKLILTQEINSNSESIDMSKTASGLYFVKIDNNGIITNKKIIKK